MNIAPIERRGCPCTVTAGDIPPGMDPDDIVLPCEENPLCPTRARNEGRDLGWELLKVFAALPPKTRKELPCKINQFLKKASENKNFSYHHRELLTRILS